jgi:hypothetical protein
MVSYTLGKIPVLPGRKSRSPEAPFLWHNQWASPGSFPALSPYRGRGSRVTSVATLGLPRIHVSGCPEWLRVASHRDAYNKRLRITRAAFTWSTVKHFIRRPSTSAQPTFRGVGLEWNPSTVTCGPSLGRPPSARFKTPGDEGREIPLRHQAFTRT